MLTKIPMKRIILLLSVFICIACGKETKKTSVNGFELAVKAKKIPDSTKVYLYDENIEVKMDSAYVLNESFEFYGKVDYPSLCYLFFYDRENMRSKNYKYLFIENSDINIDGEFSDFLNARVTGSEQTDLLTRYDSISANSDELTKVPNQLDFIYSNANNQMTLNALLHKKKEISKDSLLLFHKKLDSINANSPKGQELLAYTKAVQVKTGDKFRDILGNDLNKIEHKLSDYYGKVILLNFYSPTCGYCRQQHKKEFPRLIEKYNKDNFILISYNVDENKKEWKKLSQKEYINWLNISDLKGMKGENVSKYDVTGVPNNFLIDKNGIIVNSFVGFYEGQNRLEMEIDQLLK